MQSAYRKLVLLYPKEYRDAFGLEMAAVFEEARTKHHGSSLWKRILFAGAEVLGLLAGAIREHVAKWTNPSTYVTEIGLVSLDQVPDTVDEAQGRVRACIQAMEHAIAHHDFPKARRFSNEERVAREHLNRLIQA